MVPAVRVEVPSVAEPSVKVTVPVAVEGVTVAVSVTFWPKVEGFTDEASDVVVKLTTLDVQAGCGVVVVFPNIT